MRNRRKLAPQALVALGECVNHHSATIPATPATAEAAKIPVLAAARAGVVPNARPAMKSDIVKPMPVSTDPAASTDHLKFEGRVARRRRAASQLKLKTPAGLPRTRPATTAVATGSLMPAHDSSTPALARANVGMMTNPDQ